MEQLDERLIAHFKRTKISEIDSASMRATERRARGFAGVASSNRRNTRRWAPWFAVAGCGLLILGLVVEAIRSDYGSRGGLGSGPSSSYAARPGVSDSAPTVVVMTNSGQHITLQSETTTLRAAEQSMKADDYSLAIPTYLPFTFSGDPSVQVINDQGHVRLVSLYYQHEAGVWLRVTETPATIPTNSSDTRTGTIDVHGIQAFTYVRALPSGAGQGPVLGCQWTERDVLYRVEGIGVTNDAIGQVANSLK